MIFKKLVLKNFKSYEDTCIDFSSGITMITGENGAGKSSIFEAISFALFKQHNGLINNLIRYSKNKMSISLSFLVNDSLYTVERTRTKTSSTATLFKDGNEIASGDKNVNNEIQLILNMDKNLFLNAVYIKQGEISALLDKRPSEKKKIISELLGINDLDKAWKKSGDMINKYKYIQASLESEVKSLKELRDETNLKRDKLNSIDEKIKRINTEINHNNNTLKSMEDKIYIIKEKKELFNFYTEKLLSLDHNIKLSNTAIKDILFDLNKLKEDEGRVEDIRVKSNIYVKWYQILEKKKHLLELESHKKPYISKLNDISSNQSILENKKEDYELFLLKEEQIKDLFDTINTYENDLKKIELIRDNLESLISSIEAIDGRCPTCNTDLSSDKKDIVLSDILLDVSKHNEDIKRRNKDIKGLSDEYRVMIQERSDLREGYELYNKASLFLNEYNNSDEMFTAVGKLENEIDDILKSLTEEDKEIFDKEIEEIKKTVSENKSAHTEVDSLSRDYENEKVRLTTLLKEAEDKNKKEKTKYIEQNRQIDELCYDEDEYNDINNQVNDLKELESELNSRYNIHLGESSEIKKTIDQNEERLKQYDLKNNELKALSSHLVLLNNIRDKFSKDGVQKILRNKSKPLIQKYTKKIFDQFNFDYSDLQIDDDYNISVTGPEGVSELSMVSGGEKVVIALALRLAITQIISSNKIESILLDEPTVHLDDNKKGDLVELFSETYISPQMLIVTHDIELENAGDNIINVCKTNGISRVEQ